MELGSEVQEHLLETYWTRLGAPHLDTIYRKSLTRIKRNRNSLVLDYLEYNSKLPNTSLRNKVTVFLLNTMTYSIEHIHLDISHIHFDIPHLGHIPYHLIFGPTFALIKPIDTLHKKRHGPENVQK